MKQTKLIFR